MYLGSLAAKGHQDVLEVMGDEGRPLVVVTLDVLVVARPHSRLVQVDVEQLLGEEGGDSGLLAVDVVLVVVKHQQREEDVASIGHDALVLAQRLDRRTQEHRPPLEQAVLAADRGAEQAEEGEERRMLGLVAGHELVVQRQQFVLEPLGVDISNVLVLVEVELARLLEVGRQRVGGFGLGQGVVDGLDHILQRPERHISRACGKTHPTHPEDILAGRSRGWEALARTGRG